MKDLGAGSNILFPKPSSFTNVQPCGSMKGFCLQSRSIIFKCNINLEMDLTWKSLFCIFTVQSRRLFSNCKKNPFKKPMSESHRILYLHTIAYTHIPIQKKINVLQYSRMCTHVHTLAVELHFEKILAERRGEGGEKWESSAVNGQSSHIYSRLQGRSTQKPG